MHFLLGGNESKREVYMNVKNVAKVWSGCGHWENQKKILKNIFSQNFLSISQDLD